MLRDDKVDRQHKYRGTHSNIDELLHSYSPRLELVVVGVQGRDIGLNRSRQPQANHSKATGNKP